MRIGVALGMSKSPEFIIDCDSGTTVAAFKGLILTHLDSSRAFLMLGASLSLVSSGKLVGGKEWRGQRAYNVERGGFPTPAGGFTSDMSDDSALFDAEGSVVLLPDEAAAKAAHNAAAVEADALPLEHYGVTDGAVIMLMPHLRSGGALNLK